jgi:hypothetical protein
MVKRNTSAPEVEVAREWSPIDSWGGFSKGDLVHVKGTSSSEWRFMYAHDRNGQIEAVTVFGGERATKRMAATQAYRTFVPERVVAPSVTQRRSVRTPKHEVEVVS